MLGLGKSWDIERERSTEVPLNKKGKPLKERDKYERSDLAK